MSKFNDSNDFGREKKRKIDDPEDYKRRGLNWTQIIVALIGLVGVIFSATIPIISIPSSTSSEKQTIIGAIIYTLNDNNGSSILTFTPNVVETLVAQTLTAMPPLRTVEPTARVITATSEELATNTPEAIIATTAPEASRISTQPNRATPTTLQQSSSTTECFYAVYTIPSDRYSGCPGIPVEAGYQIPPSSILQPNADPDSIWIYLNGGSATSGGILWEYRTEMYGGGEAASRACVEAQFQYFSSRTPIYR